MRKTAIITGGTKGIGAAIGLALAEDGYDLVVNYRRDAESAAAFAKEVEERDQKCITVQADQTEDGAVDKIFDAAAKLENVDVFVANAASTKFAPLKALKSHQIDKTLAVTVRSYILGAQRAAELMKGRKGNIIAISGMDTVHTVPFHGLLGACKSAMETLTHYLAAELSPDIRVNAINPGIIDTASSRYYAGDNYEKVAKATAQVTPARRVGTPEDVAKAVRFLISDDADYITGITLHVDGGLQVAPFLLSVFGGG